MPLDRPVTMRGGGGVSRFPFLLCAAMLLQSTNEIIRQRPIHLHPPVARLQALERYR